MKADHKFQAKVQKWYTNQGWRYTNLDDMNTKIALQFSLLLINKIMFYNVVKDRYHTIIPQNYKLFGLPEELPKIEIPESIEHGGIVSQILKGYFNYILKIDYETVFLTEFMDNIELPDEAVPLLRAVVEELDKYNFSTIEYEIIGNIFQSLIPEEDRHILGQYFTRSDVVDLIVGGAVRYPDAKVLDPACGAGTFLVRTYSRERYLGSNAKHQEMLKRFWGCDIAEFPAHLATINLAIRDLSETENYPIIARTDFFKVVPNTPISQSSFVARGINAEERKKAMPLFDAVVTNPPYTRQEEMEEKTAEGYKKSIVELIEKETGIKPGLQSSIYSFFFFHGYAFLRNRGRMGLIVSNSWLDVRYGKFLQEFFLKNFKIIAIMESKVERWFTEADVNTSIIILEKCTGKNFEEERNRNKITFVQFRKTLPEVLSNFDSKKPFEEWTDRERWAAIDEFYSWLEGINKNVIDEEKSIRVYHVSQKELWKEGFNPETSSFEGAKWGKYLRAPDIFFKILEKGKGKLVPLEKVADVRFGIKTGANEFFYLPKPGATNKNFKGEMDNETGDLILKDMFHIEKEYWMHIEEGDKKELEKVYEFIFEDSEGKVWVPNYVLKSPKEVKKIVVEPRDLNNVILIVHDKKKDLQKGIKEYINWGEDSGFHKRPTCASRKRWYDLGAWEIPDILWSDAYSNRFIFPLVNDNLGDKRFFYITFKDKNLKIFVNLFLNSSLVPILIDIEGITSLGDGAVYTNVYWLKRLKVPHKIPKKLREKINEIYNEINKRELGSIFTELGANTPDDVTLNKVRKDRRELDKIVMGDILSLSDDEQLEVYKAVIDLVKSRLDRAKSVKKNKARKGKYGIKIEELAEYVTQTLDNDLIGEIASFEPVEYKEVQLPEKGEPIVGVNLHGIPYVELNGERFECTSVNEANYIRFMYLLGQNPVRVPLDDEILFDIVDKLKYLAQTINRKAADIVNKTVPDEKIKENLRKKIIKNVFGSLLISERF